MSWCARGVLAVLAGAVITVSGCAGEAAAPPPADPPPTSAAQPPAPPRTGRLATTGWGPAVPTRGAWLGAWVKADWETPQGRAAALEGFAGQGGSRLAIAHMYHQWTDEFPSPTQVAFQSAGRLQLISWSGTDTRSVTSGVYDQLIRARAEAIRDYGHPVLLRWRWEMDRPNLAAKIHSPADYVAAWKHIRAIFAATGTRNAGFVWCPHVQGFVDSKRQGAAYYPGDDQVDWLCADAYSEEGFAGFGEQMDAFMAFARTRPRPVLVGEFGVTGDGTDAQRAAWLREVREYVKRQPQIKGLVYFSEKMARPPHYDTTLAAGSQAAAAWRELATDPHFGAPPPTAGASPPAG